MPRCLKTHLAVDQKRGTNPHCSIVENLPSFSSPSNSDTVFNPPRSRVIGVRNLSYSERISAAFLSTASSCTFVKFAIVTRIKACLMKRLIQNH